MVFIHDRLNRLGVRVGEYTSHTSRRERQLREALGVGRPRYDVDALTGQLVHDRLDTAALQPYARTHRIDRVVAADDGDLGAAPHLPGGSPDRDDRLLDFRHLEREERLNEQRIGPRQDQTRTFGRLLEPLQDGTYRVALVKSLAMVLLAIRNDRLRLAEPVDHDHELAALDLLDLG